MTGLISFLAQEGLNLAYLLAAILFIQGLRYMNHPRTASRGNLVSAAGMLIAILATLLWFEILSPVLLGASVLVGAAIGAWLAYSTDTTEMPQLVGLFNGLGGGASALVAGAEIVDSLAASTTLPIGLTLSAGLTAIVGSMTFWGSLVAAGKLHGWIEGSIIGDRVERLMTVVFAVLSIMGLTLLVSQVLPGILLSSWAPVYWLTVLAAAFLGVFLVLPVGGADMPVVIALLNSFSGLAAAATGFVLGNILLIIAGTLVGASGLILTFKMCEAMNRPLRDVLFGSIEEQEEEMEDVYEGQIKETSAEEVVMLLESASRVVIVPGYGMAVAGAQNAAAELVELLEEDGVDVEFGIHPVAGRMPGHMNALLAEADVSYEKMRELEEVNPEFSQTDVVIVTGANDVVNPRAKRDESSPISGMPVLNVEEAQSVIVNKRSLSPGFSGISNPLFANDNTSMLFGDAREKMQELVRHYKKEVR